MERKCYERIGEEVIKGVLGNGLRYIVVPKKEYTKAYAFFATNYGGVNRRFRCLGKMLDTPMGVAHFLEHKMFDMPDGSALTRLAERGASPNAFTSDDITAYHFSCTCKFDENLETLLTFVSTPYFTEESVKKERGIIGQEIGMVEDSPSHRLYYDMLGCLYKNHPIRDSVAGTVESIAEITVDTLYSCHKVFYRPSNMALCVVGNVDPDRVIHAADRILPRELTFPPTTDYGPEEPRRPALRRSVREMAVSRPQFAIGAKVDCPTRGEELLRTRLLGDLAATYLAGTSTPLYARLYESGKIAKDFGTYFDTCAGAAFAMLSGEGESPEEVYDAVIAEAERIGETGGDRALFDRLKKAYIGGTLRALNSFDTLCYNGAKGLFAGYDAFNEMSVLDRISYEDVCSFTGRYFTHEKTVLSVVGPFKNN